MLKDIKEILFAEIKDEITEYEEISNRITEMNNKVLELKARQQKIQAIIGIFGASKSEDVVKLNQPKMPSMIIKKFSFWDKWLFNRKEYQQIERLNKEAQEKYERELKEYNQKKEKYNEEKSTLEEEILELENKIKELEDKKNNDIRTKFEIIKDAKTLKDLSLSFEDAKKILEDNNKELVLDESDKEITLNESNFDKPEDFILVHKTEYSPINDEIKSNKTAKATQKNTIYFGEEEFSYEYELARNTIHLCPNGEVSSHEYGSFDGRKYAVLIPFKNVRDDKRIVSFSPEDTYFEEKVDAREGYILCPKEEVEKIKQANPNTNVIGYDGGSVDGFAASFISMLGYKHEEISKHSWQSEEDAHKFYQFVSENTDLERHWHAGSYQYFRDQFLEYFNECIGFTKGVVESKKEGKNIDALVLTKVLLRGGTKYCSESGKTKIETENRGHFRGASFTSLIENACSPYTNQKLYLKEFVKDEDFKDDSDNEKDSNVNFLFYKLEKEFNIRIPQDIKELLRYSGNNTEEFIKLIQDEDTKKLLNDMKEEGYLSINEAKDAIFLKTIIEQVYREQILDKKEIKTKDIAEADKSMEIASSETYEAEQILENLKEKDKEIEEKQD